MPRELKNIETQIQGNQVRTITIFYTGIVENWDELFRNVAAAYGLRYDDPAVRFIARPRNESESNDATP